MSQGQRGPILQEEAKKKLIQKHKGKQRSRFNFLFLPFCLLLLLFPQPLSGLQREVWNKFDLAKTVYWTWSDPSCFCARQLPFQTPPLCICTFILTLYRCIGFTTPVSTLGPSSLHGDASSSWRGPFVVVASAASGVKSLVKVALSSEGATCAFASRSLSLDRGRVPKRSVRGLMKFGVGERGRGEEEGSARSRVGGKRTVGRLGKAAGA